MNPIFNEALSGLKTVVDSALTGASAEVPALSADALSFLENTVAPKLDVPAPIIAYFSTQNATVQAEVDPIAQAELAFLKARIDALFPAAA